jgi:mannose-1-phosphate guanylyltransferase
MKAMVLAAGLGLRMRPLTLLRPKPVLPVLNRPLLHWTLELLARHGVSDVVINLHHLPEVITQAVGRGRRFGLRVSYSREARILGTGGGPRKARRLLGDEPVLLVNGDMLFDFDLTRLVDRHRASGAGATLALKPNPDTSTYGPVVTGPKGHVRSLPGSPRSASGTVSLFTGVHVLDPRLLERLPPGPSDSVRDLYAGLVAEGEGVHGVRVAGPWYDLSSPSKYLASHISLLKREFGGAGWPARVDPRASVHPSARVERSVIGAGSVVGQGARVERCVLWDGVRVGRGARVRDSILADGVSVDEGETLRGLVALDAARARGARPSGPRKRREQMRLEIESA